MSWLLFVFYKEQQSHNDNNHKENWNANSNGYYSTLGQPCIRVGHISCGSVSGRCYNNVLLARLGDDSIGEVRPVIRISAVLLVARRAGVLLLDSQRKSGLAAGLAGIVEGGSRVYIVELVEATYSSSLDKAISHILINEVPIIGSKAYSIRSIEGLDDLFELNVDSILGNSRLAVRLDNANYIDWVVSDVVGVHEVGLEINSSFSSVFANSYSVVNNLADICSIDLSQLWEIVPVVNE